MSESSRSVLSVSGSKFKETDWELLGILIINDYDCITREPEIHDDLKPFILSGCSESEAKRPDSVKTPLETKQRRFLGRLGTVLTKESEKYVDNFLSTFLVDSGFDDGVRLVCEPGSLQLKIGSQTRAALPDKECKVYPGNMNSSAVLWTVVENKIKSSLVQDEHQLAVSMIAAMQYNHNNFNEQDILGIIVTRSNFRFYRCNYDQTYMQALQQGFPISHTIVINRLCKRTKRARKNSVFQSAVDLDILVPESRAEILQYLTYYRKFADRIKNEMNEDDEKDEVLN